MDGYRFTVTCPSCGGELRQIQSIRQSPMSNIAIVQCPPRPRGCGKQHDLTVRLTPLRK